MQSVICLADWIFQEKFCVLYKLISQAVKTQASMWKISVHETWGPSFPSPFHIKSQSLTYPNPEVIEGMLIDVGELLPYP